MRPIDADALVEAVKDYPYGFRGMIVCDIAKQPTIDPVRHGKWEEREVHEKGNVDIDEWQSARCSVCGRYHTTPYRYHFDEFAYCPDEFTYCPNCGVRMDGGTDNETD